MKRDDLKSLLKVFISWRILLFVFLYLAIFLFPLQTDFLGGGLDAYNKDFLLWSWVNFDGEHFLSIAYQGYKSLQYFFFPMFPMFTGWMAKWLGGSLFTHVYVGLLLSNIVFFVGLVGLIKLIKLDFSGKVAWLTVFLLLLFPTSFYFASFYSESLFFALVVWSFYFARKKRWLSAGLLAGLATATRVVGIVMFPVLLVEIWEDRIDKGVTKDWEKKLLGLLLAPAGFIIYLLYLKEVTGDPLEFFHNIGIYGQQRAASFILLPQVIYRYIFKILPNINYSYFPVVFSTWLEFIAGLLFGGLGILGILGSLEKLERYKIRWSYTVFLIVAYLVPTFAGSFSSMSRYVLVLFPGFLLISIWLTEKSILFKRLVLFFLFIILVIATSLFTRGYWVA